MKKKMRAGDVLLCIASGILLLFVWLALWPLPDALGR